MARRPADAADAIYSQEAQGLWPQAQIEGDIHDGDARLLVEDLATDGRSKVNFCNALRDAGQPCDHALVFFFYDIFPHAQQMQEIDVNLHYLVTWWDVLDAARAHGYFPASVLDEVEKFLRSRRLVGSAWRRLRIQAGVKLYPAPKTAGYAN